MESVGHPDRSGELRSALSACRYAFVGTAAISGVVNVLYLTGSFFMLEVYDRVIPSRSIPTLVGLVVLALMLYCFQGVLEILRSRVLARVGAAFDEALSERVFDVVVRAPLHGAAPSDGLLPMRDLDQLRSFFSGTGPSAFFDLPWMPIYVAICFVFHPLIGVSAIAGVAILATVTLVTDRATRGPTQAATSHGLKRTSLAEAGRRNAEVLAAMGMQERILGRWSAANRDHIKAHQRASDVAGGYGAITKVFRTALQSGVLALGAWLVINNQATAGIIIASSILVSRALAPAELAIANWRGFVQARQAWGRLSRMLARVPAATPRHPLPAPKRSVSAELISVAPPGVQRIVVNDLAFTLQSGQAMGVIGPSASGKSSLARALVGVWTPLRGKVRLDGAALDQWSSAALGPHVGFMPQEVELFAGTVAENIARFEPNAAPDDVVAAGVAAGAHDMILHLPEGYDTPIGENGAGLSAGQRQRIGLARALYRDPFLVVLDEPNSHLDNDGDIALTQAILGVRRRGGVCVVVAHRPSALAAVDMILVMHNGRAQAFGPKDEVLKQVMRPTAVHTAPQEAPAAIAGTPDGPRAIPSSATA
ncbi:type I secretion system permease/ATPase [Alsobacter sp. SYSU BS001988]